MLLLVFGSYVLTNLARSQGITNIFQLVLLILGLGFLFYMRSAHYSRIHYNAIVGILGLCIFLKILFDWLFTNYNKALSGAVVPLLSGMTIYLKVNFVYITFYNTIFLFSFILRLDPQHIHCSKIK